MCGKCNNSKETCAKPSQHKASTHAQSPRHRNPHRIRAHPPPQLDPLMAHHDRLGRQEAPGRPPRLCHHRLCRQTVLRLHRCSPRQLCSRLLPRHPCHPAARRQQLKRPSCAYSKWVLGTEDYRMARLDRPHFPHPEHFLRGLGQLRRFRRRHPVLAPWLDPVGRPCTHMGRTLH